MPEPDASAPASPPSVFEKLFSALKELTAPQRMAAALLCVFACFVVYDQMYYWLNREDYEFGFLVAFFVLYVVYDRWPRIRALAVGAPGEPTAPEDPLWKRALAGFFFYGMTLGALPMLALGGFLRLVTGVNENSSVLLTLGFGFFCIGIVYCVGEFNAQGRALCVRERLKLCGLFVFPAFIWIISAPLLILFETRVKLALLNLVTTVVFGIFDVLGYPIIQEGNVLQLPLGAVGVAEACSGIRSLTGCIFAGAFLAAVYFDSWGKKLLLVFAGAALAVCTNIVRSCFLTAWAYAYGPDAIAGTVHDITGYAVLGVTCVLLLILVHLLNRQWIPPIEDESAPPENPPA